MPFENSVFATVLRPSAANQCMRALVCIFVNCFQPNNQTLHELVTGFILSVKYQSPNELHFQYINDARAANCFVINSDFYQLNTDRNFQNTADTIQKHKNNMYTGEK